MRIRPFQSSVAKRTASKKRRDRLAELGRCINSALPDDEADPRGPIPRIAHGPPVAGRKKCQRCIDVHKGKTVADEYAHLEHGVAA